MVHSPGFLAVTVAYLSPCPRTVATFTSLDFHVKRASVVLSGYTVAVISRISPTSSTALSGSSSIYWAGTIGFLTVIAQVPATSPHVAVILQVPWATAVTTPLSSTLATDESLDVHTRLLSVVFSGYILAARVMVPPTSSSALSGVSSTTSAKISFSLTVISHDAPKGPQFTLTTHWPTPTAVTKPLASTSATDWLFVFHTRFTIEDKLSGHTVAINSSVSPTWSSLLVRFSVIESGTTSSTLWLGMMAPLGFSPLLFKAMFMPAALLNIAMAGNGNENKASKMIADLSSCRSMMKKHK